MNTYFKGLQLKIGFDTAVFSEKKKKQQLTVSINSS